ncbi:hypothetical protein OC845_004786 [Tilletia horrida]|nr:hypothetical protein OC845_004786 [Tilletia horrida]
MVLLPGPIAEAAALSGSLPTELITRAAEAYPKPAGVKFAYGTAGVRTKGDILESTCFRFGLVAALRSKKCGGKAVGLMVTASHNPEPDNGLKMVDPRGEMLESSWEAYCTEIANVDDPAELIAALEKLAQTTHIDLSTPATVVFAHDTRPSSPKLVKAIVTGLAAFGVNMIEGGLLTTPQLHYLVRAHNTAGSPDAYGEPSEEGYYKKLAAAYVKLVSDKPPMTPLIVDCANGVGAKSLTAFAKHVPEEHFRVLPLRTSITTPGALNNGCGADYVKTSQKLPVGFEQEEHVKPGERMCAYDGDADRLIYFYVREAKKGCIQTGELGEFRLLDGDKIATLVTDYLNELVQKAEVELEVGCVQTAYANGSSTKYLTKRNVPIKCTPTGVKYLHHAAESYDIGVYFEANGHGTVLFSVHSLETIKTALQNPASPAAQDALTQLQALTELINQTVGDALSDMLLVEVVLRSRQWGPEEWDGAYDDLPNKLLKVVVKDRSVFRTTDAERRLVTPAGLQEKMDEVVRKYEDARSFVRPSGTEDCVRVYAEAARQGDLEALAAGVAKLVTEYS